MPRLDVGRRSASYDGPVRRQILVRFASAATWPFEISRGLAARNI
jgi:hypothetical protein